MTEGLFVGVNANQPGDFVILRGGAPLFSFAESPATGGPIIHMKYDRATAPGRVTLDVERHYSRCARAKDSRCPI